MTRKLSAAALRRAKARLKTARRVHSIEAWAHGQKAPPPRIIDPVLSLASMVFPKETWKFTSADTVEGTVCPPPAFEYLGELPDSYGTKAVFLVARDPHCLYAYWDLTEEQKKEALACSSDQKLVLEIFHQPTGHCLHRRELAHGEKGAYFGVEAADSDFHCRLGVYTLAGDFVEVAHSKTVHTPRDSIAPITQPQFATIPFAVPLGEWAPPSDQLTESRENPGSIGSGHSSFEFLACGAGFPVKTPTVSKSALEQLAKNFQRHSLPSSTRYIRGET